MDGYHRGPKKIVSNFKTVWNYYWISKSMQLDEKNGVIAPPELIAAKPN